MLLKTKKRLLIIFTAIVMALLIGATATGLVKVFSEKNTPTISAESITAVSDSYGLGDKLEVPESVSILYKDNTYTSTYAYIRTPAGKLLTASNCTLNEIGKYTLIYSVEVDGKLISAEKSFNVNSQSNMSSSIVAVTKLDKLTNIKDATMGGINVEIPNGNKFIWGEAVNLAELGKDNAFLSFSPDIFSGMVGNNATAYSTPVVKYVVVRITDAYNPEVYVDFYLDVGLETSYDKYLCAQMPAYSVGAVGQFPRSMSPDIGRDDRDGEIIYVDGKEYFVNYNEWYGYPTLGNVDKDGSLINLFYDIETQQAFVEQKTDKDLGVYKKVMINDLDAKEIYPTNSFKGFTNGEVYLSIFGEYYQLPSDTLDIEIASIGNRSSVQLHDEYVNDDVAPSLILDISDEQIANQVFVPFGKTIKLPGYTCFDANMKKDGGVTISVSYYGKKVAVKDNSFITNNTGKYVVTYTAVDDYGNENVKEIVYNSVDETVVKIMNFSYTPVTEDVYAGQNTTISSYNIDTENKFYSVSGYYYFDEKPEVKYEFDVDNPVVVFQNVGSHHVVYEYSDFYGSYSTEYTLNVKPSEDFSFTNLSLPRQMIKGYKYTLEPVYAKVYTGADMQAVEVVPKYSLDGGQTYNTVANPNEFAVTADAGASYKFKYEHTVGSNTEVIESAEILVVDTKINNKLALQNYFVDDPLDNSVGAEAVSVNNNIQLKATAAGKENAITTRNSYANTLSIKGLELSFTILQDSLDGVKFTFTDYYNPSNVMVVQYLSNGSKTRIVVDGMEIVASKPLKNTLFRFFYEPKANGFSDDNISYFYNYDNRFESDYVFLDIELLNVFGDTTFQFGRINGQNIKNGGSDSAGPVISYSDTFTGARKLGEVITVSRGYAADVMCPLYFTPENFTFTLEYVDTSAGYEEPVPVEDVNGLVLADVSALKEYVVKLPYIGEYTITYKAIDQNNKIQFAFNSITVADDSAPVIELADGYNESTIIEAEKGGVHIAQNYTISDNLDSNEDLIIATIVITPWCELYDIKPGNNYESEDMSFELTLYGEYRVYYYAQDTSGNITTRYYTVFVK